MTERKLIRAVFRFRRWLVPTLVAPALGAWLAVTVFALLGYRDPKFGDAFENWVLGMALGTAFGAGMSAVLVGVDVALLRLRARLLPTGARAWWPGAASVPVLLAVWRFWPGDASSPSFWIVPPLAIAVALRASASPRPA